MRPWSIFTLRPLERVAEYSEAVAAASPTVSAPAAPAVTAPAAIISPPAPAAAVDWQALAWRGAAVVWLVGLAALLAYGVWSWLRLRRQVSAAVWNGGNVWECDAIPTPFVLGYVQPRIYIPFHLDSDERTYVLAHERYHLRRGDQWWKLLSCLILAVYWWDAAAWLCWVLFCRDLEMRCDEAVLAQLGDQVKRGYSLSLVSFAMERRFPAALAFGGHDAARRVKHVLAWKKETHRVAFLAAAVVLVVWMVHDVVTRVRPDYRVGYVGSSNLPTDTVTALENTLAAYCDDRNGDGKVVVELVQYDLDFDSESENTDAYIQMADVTRLSADLSSEDGPYIFIMQDTDYAQQFAETIGVLQYLDGTMPDTENVDENDNVIVDWTKMVYRWTDCPALTGLDLGTYTGLTMVDDLQGENQDIMKNTYIGRRAYYTDKTALESETYDALWNILTAGAVSTVGQQ